MEPSRDTILERVRRAGVVGAGGGGFPAHAKLAAQAEVVIANGAECEPLSRVDQQRMQREPERLLRGLRLAMRAVGAKQGVVALKAKYHDAIEALDARLRLEKPGPEVRLHLLNDFYPAGDEFVLVREVLGRVIPEFGLPLSVGAVVQNVSTLIDVAAAVDGERPVTSRFVTVTGAVASPATFEVPLGTPLALLLRAAGGPATPNPALIAGGPMMGALASGPEAPVTKTLNTLLVLPEQHPVVQRRRRNAARQIQLTRSACLKCMMCTEVCPRNLLGHRLYPDRLMRSLAASVTEDLSAYQGAYLCSECGLCAVYGCVMSLDPAAVHRELKARMSRAGVPRPEPRQTSERVFGPLRAVPSKRLIARLGLTPYDRPAPIREFSETIGSLTFPLKQHAGMPAVPRVKPGQRVKAGELLADVPEGKLGAALHASRAGKVVEVTDAALRIEVG